MDEPADVTPGEQAAVDAMLDDLDAHWPFPAQPLTLEQAQMYYFGIYYLKQPKP